MVFSAQAAVKIGNKFAQSPKYRIFALLFRREEMVRNNSEDSPPPAANSQSFIRLYARLTSA
jgi:hypothetical protein